MKWEYAIRYIYTPVSSPDQVGLLNEFGEEGWELASLDSGYAVFKRPKVVVDEPS
jgi:hypothetical protein